MPTYVCVTISQQVVYMRPYLCYMYDTACQFRGFSNESLPSHFLCRHHQSAPYQLEALVETFSTEAPNVRLALLTAAVQLFFKRPPETKKLLGGLLSAGIADSHTDVHDRALMYYR